MNEEQAQVRAEIRPVKQRIEDELLAKANVVGVDISEKISDGKPTGELAIVVYVDKKQPLSKLPPSAKIPKTVDGVKTDVQEMQIELQAPGLAVPVADIEPLVDTATYPTLVGGISMGPRRSVFMAPPDVASPGNYVFVGTLGAMVRDRATGAMMALTNFHVAAVNFTWSPGDRMVQPSRVDAPSGPEFGSLTRAVISGNVDGAVVTLDAATAWEAEIREIGDVVGTAVAAPGMAVQKRGRTTEHTFGQVVSTDVTLAINYGSDVGMRTLRNQIRIAPDTTRNARFSSSGDSGSVIVNNDRRVVGLLFAGATDGSATFANPIAAAENELGVDIVARAVAPTRPPGCPPWLTRPPLCPNDILTRSPRCPIDIFTRPPSCPIDILTRPPRCPIIVTRPPFCPGLTRQCPTNYCPPVTRACGGGPSGPRSSSEAADDYGSDPAADAFAQGYLAAFEVMAEAEYWAQEG